ncbi:MAG: T9SS type A sorting domain-containing protein, partial [Flavobacteriaceae bacterium]|nr:T9SS type A sorting domain-containing protein [Flavobacteriaceae bacterium]
DIEVWFKTGSFVGFETDPGPWTLLDTAVGITSAGDGVPTPLNLSLGQSVTAGETVAFYVTTTLGGTMNYTNGTAVGAVFASDANLEFLEGNGGGYPFSVTFSPRVWNGNIHYTPGGGVSTTLDFDCSNLGANVIEVTVTDPSGNASTCMATVNVNDVTDPILICQDVTIELDENGMADIDPAALLANMPGTFEVVTISSDNGSGAEGFTDFTVSVTDAATVSFDWDYSTMDGPAFDSFGYLLNGAYTELTDPAGANNQSGNSGAINVVPGDVFGFRSQSLDGVFGPATTVVSNFMPGFTGQFDPANWTLTLDNSDGDAFFVEIPGGPLSFDACGITVLAVDVTEVSCADIGTPITATVFASDASGNLASCTSEITVVDAMGPEITCPADQTQDPGVGNLFYEVPDYWALGEATATDNCTDPVTITSQDPAAGELLPDGVYTVTITAEDEYGNVSTCTFELTVESVLGIEDNALDSAIALYPNPAQNIVNLVNSSNIALEAANLYDINGKLIKSVDLSDMLQEKTIDVANLASGVYVVHIVGEQASTVKRLIKE